MTAPSRAGAAPHDPTDWHAINWPKVHQNVRRLQARIVQATKQGRWGKVKALQRLLTRSFSGKALAVRRVTENQGKNTPGVDQITWNHTTYLNIVAALVVVALVWLSRQTAPITHACHDQAAHDSHASAASSALEGVHR